MKISQELQYRCLEKELELVQGQVDKYDDSSAATKRGAAMLWLAIAGWTFQVKHAEFMAVAAGIVASFWLFDAVNKVFRQDYARRRDEVVELMNAFRRSGELSPHIRQPNLPKQPWRGMLRVFPSALLVHVSLTYVALLAATYAAYLIFRTLFS